MTDFGAPPGPDRELIQGDPTYPDAFDPGYGPYPPAGGTAWWIGWATLFVLAVVVFADRNPDTIDGLAGYITLEIVGVGVRIVTGVLAILLVAKITRAQTARMQPV